LSARKAAFTFVTVNWIAVTYGNVYTEGKTAVAYIFASLKLVALDSEK